jgi:hypothetical protein
VDNWDWLADAFGNLEFGDNTFSQYALRLRAGASGVGYAATGSIQCLGFMPSFITANSAAPDTCLWRNAAGVMNIGNGTQGDRSGKLNVGSLNLSSYTIATLPSAATAGAGTSVMVTDATTFTPGTCTGGGVNFMIAVTNGTTWSCH